MQHISVAIVAVIAFVFVVKVHATGGQYCFIGTNNLDTILESSNDIYADILINPSDIDDVSVQEKLRRLKDTVNGRVTFGLVLTPPIISRLKSFKKQNLARQIRLFKFNSRRAIGFKDLSVGIFKEDWDFGGRLLEAGFRRVLAVEGCFDSDDAQVLATHFPVLSAVTSNEGENPELTGAAVTS